MKNPRIQVSFEPNDIEVIQALAAKKKLSASAFVNSIVKEYLEDYEDMILALRAEKAEKEGYKGHLYSHEEVWNKLGM